MVLGYVSPRKEMHLWPRAVLWRREQLCIVIPRHTPSSLGTDALIGKWICYLRLWSSTKGPLKGVVCKPLETSIYSAPTLGHSQRIQREKERWGWITWWLWSCRVTLPAFSQNKKWKEDGVWCEAEEGKEFMAFFLIRKQQNLLGKEGLSEQSATSLQITK